MGDFIGNDEVKASTKRLASSVSTQGNTTIDEDMLLRNANFLNLQITSLYAASCALHKVSTILNKLRIPSWV